MKRNLLAGLTAAAVLTLGCSDNGPLSVNTAQAEDLSTVDQRISYILGLSMGEQFKRGGVDLDIDAFVLALKDIEAGAEPRLSEDEVQMAMRALQDRQAAEQAKMQEGAKVVADANQKEGQAFLAENKSKDGVVVTDSGLQYKVLTAGSGKKPAASDNVTVHYRGTLIDGTEFDSSYSRNEPATFPVQGVIRGWVEALQLMQEGAKWELYIPSELAYGPGGTSGAIGPNATLIFEVELLKVGG